MASQSYSMGVSGNNFPLFDRQSVELSSIPSTTLRQAQDKAQDAA
ncbi:MAG: hypothetical protein ACE5HA_10190 [Anaerolineae bacterium]